ncbi:hypothetical protein H9Q69_011140 [Fusarium xylarioides]|nr:hypothetical protein H9Q70_012481 [Fusarium xylarioides]KAG5776165.1 hypothetical protein H9Q73_010174 [Fusarium xylarioides]KAG5789797.1 hypothetical protein H9Q69_011140 [Fusarium xylarioides]
MAPFMELYTQIHFILNHLEHSIRETKDKCPEVFGPRPYDNSGTIIPTPEEMAALVEHMHQVGPLVDALMILSTEKWQQQLAERHKGRFSSSQNEVLQMLQDLKRLEGTK